MLRGVELSLLKDPGLNYWELGGFCRKQRLLRRRVNSSRMQLQELKTIRTPLAEVIRVLLMAMVRTLEQEILTA